MVQKRVQINLLGAVRASRHWTRRCVSDSCSRCEPPPVLCSLGRPFQVQISILFFGILQLIQSLGMKSLEIPTDPRSGMDRNFLEQAMRRRRVRACIVISNCHNTLGYVLTDKTKLTLAEISKPYKVPIIEDDLFDPSPSSPVLPTSSSDPTGAESL